MSKKNKNKETKEAAVDNELNEIAKEIEGEFDLNDELVVDDNGNTFVTDAGTYVESEAVRPSEQPTEPNYTCADAARRFIVGYKDHWLHGIEAHIKSHNAQLTGTESYFKPWFISWGAQVK